MYIVFIILQRLTTMETVRVKMIARLTQITLNVIQENLVNGDHVHVKMVMCTNLAIKSATKVS